MHPDYSILIEKSIRAKKHSYSPYSRFSVGAALLTTKNKIYTGANVENASYSLCICAERVAYTKAVSEGDKKFKAIAIAANGKEFVFPCGACRQFMYEFGDDIDVIVVRSLRQFRIVKLFELLPGAFDKTFLNIK
ncbi:MAG TPA: cytidine deaminase [Ignavibacteria bacterium]|nr:cytidine deaminase [Ignavibacteria bacterium]HMR39011.1 cytidine deaminase [Ignavibacteria bacterium]